MHPHAFHAIRLFALGAVLALPSLGQAQICCSTEQIVYRVVQEPRQVTRYRLEYETVVEERERTVQRPVWETEMRTRRVRVAKPVTETSERQETVTVLRPVVDERVEERVHNVVRYVDETSVRQERYFVQRPIVQVEEREQRYTVQRPVTSTVMQDYQYTAYRPVTQMQTQMVQTSQAVDQVVDIPGAYRNRLNWQQGGFAVDPATGQTYWQRGGFFWNPVQTRAATQVVQRAYVPQTVAVQQPVTSYMPEVVTAQRPVNVTQYVAEEVVTKVGHTPRVPVGEAYGRVENPKGELGFYVVSDGTSDPVRCHIRAPGLMNVLAIPVVSVWRLYSDMAAIIGSRDFVMGEVDR